jgi:ubiquinone/menaquinone biosynthesis C-methylase UbiE
MGMNLDVRPWELLTNIAKESARGWFIKRAEDRGIAWSESVKGFESHQDELNEIYEKIVDSSLDYPDYYTKPFHGYDYGNLGWTAAHELEAATQSMCLGYYEGMTWEDAQELFRGAARTSINDYWQETRTEPGAAAQKLLDVGCSGGFSSNEMAKVFPEAKITGVDLSPYFLSVAKHTYPHLDFVHANAEDTKLPAESQDVAALNFILHELPLEASRAVLQEMHRVTAPGGVIAILDVDPRRLLELPPFRRWAFQVTEPWCKDGEYYSLKLEEELESLGFTNVRLIGNDPVNKLVLATKK